jgi:Tfp pilus assembly protein PilF
VTAEAPERGPARLVGVALVLLTFLVYGRVAGYPFLRFDDASYVVDNPAVNAGLSAEGVRWAFTAFHSSNWHPLTWLSHMLDCQLFGLDAGKHHLVSVLLHALTALLCLAFFLRATGRLWPSAFVAAAFALHPLRVQSVAWISERKDVLAGVFFFLALLAHLAQARAPAGSGARRRAYGLLLLAFVGGLLAKPTVVTLPVVLLVVDLWPLQRWRDVGPARLVQEKVPLVLLALLSALLTVSAQRAGGALGSLAELPLDARISNALAAYGTYVVDSFAPLGLAYFYPHPALVDPGWTVFGPRALVPAALLVGFTVLLCLGRARHAAPLAGWSWFGLMLVPVIGLVQVGEQSHADRYAYLPLVGLHALVAFAPVPRRLRGAWPVALGLLALTWAGLAWREVGYWRDSRTLFERALVTTERNYLAETGLANVLRDDGEVERARAGYARALALRPAFVPALFSAGLLEHEAGNADAAVALYRRAIEAQPSHVQAHLNLGAVLGASGRLGEAIDAFGACLDLAPDEPSARANLEGVVARLESWLADDPDDDQARALLARARRALGSDG